MALLLWNFEKEDVLNRAKNQCLGLDSLIGNSLKLINFELSAELLVLGFDKTLRRLHVVPSKNSVHPIRASKKSGAASSDVKKHPCSVRTSAIDVSKYHSHVACMNFCASRQLLAIGGDELDIQRGTYSSTLSIWKLMDEHPFSELVFCNKAISAPGDFSQFVYSFRLRRENQAILHKVLFSPNGMYLATLDVSGKLSIWNINSFQMEKTLPEQMNENESK